jgi:hypothetical protein
VNKLMRGKQAPPQWPRMLLVGLVALLVVATGMVLLPRDSADPGALPFSGTARAAAYADAVALRESAGVLAEGQPTEAAHSALDDVVTLLTTHARALLREEDRLKDAERTGTSSPAPIGSKEPDSAAALATRLSASGGQRLRDAEEADGGMSRLLAAVGTAQVLEADRLASRLKLPAPAPVVTAPVATAPVVTAPVATPSPGSGGPGLPCPSVSPGADPTAATNGPSLAAVVRSEQEAVYVYQVALTRLSDSKAAEAAKHLAVHQQLLKEAEQLTRSNCADVPMREAGYRLGSRFTEDPAAGLGEMELGCLPALGALISEGPTRAWAAAALMAATRRGINWGAEPPALPGLAVNPNDLPLLPTHGATSTGPRTPGS